MYDREYDGLSSLNKRRLLVRNCLLTQSVSLLLILFSSGNSLDSSVTLNKYIALNIRCRSFQGSSSVFGSHKPLRHDTRFNACYHSPGFNQRNPLGKPSLSLPLCVCVLYVWLDKLSLIHTLTFGSCSGQQSYIFEHEDGFLRLTHACLKFSRQTRNSQAS